MRKSQNSHPAEKTLHKIPQQAVGHPLQQIWIQKTEFRISLGRVILAPPYFVFYTTLTGYFSINWSLRTPLLSLLSAKNIPCNIDMIYYIDAGES